MKTEENKRMLALSCIVADLKAENMELEQRVHQLMDDYNEVVRQLNGKETRKDEDSSTKTLVKLRQTEEQCYKLERENQNLKRFEKAIHAFVKDKNLYMKKDNECPYWHRGIPVCSTYCLECSSCLGVLEGHGVICEKRLKEAGVVFPSDE
ncbi:MAG: hypothetical protein SPE04_02495 [Prevotella sp.]|nr:hypothetical protein [Prevotella sp.]